MHTPIPLASLRGSIVPLALVLSFSGCGDGGGDTTGPDDPFPDVGGVYNIQGGFDGLTGDQASFVGSLTLSQASRQSGELTGTMSVTATINGEVLTAGNVPIQSASLTPSGTVSFELGSLSVGGHWTFTGTAAGETITGRHTLTDGSQSFSGDWTASKGSVGTGSVSVTTSTSGSVLDPDGYTLIIDGAGRGAVGGNTPLTVSGLAAGNHSVGLSGIAENCQVQGENPRLVPVSSGATASVTFNVVCTTPVPGTGSIHVVVPTIGADPDPDGYVATLDGGASLPVATGGSATFPDVPAGSHTVTLGGIAANCSISGPGSITTTVAAGTTSEISFSVTCTAVPPTVGSIRVTTTTSGPNPDTDGYQFVVDGGAAHPIGANAAEVVSGVPPGSHMVVLSGFAQTCHVEGGASKTVAVNAAETAEVSFALTCTPAGPSASRSTVEASPATVVAGGTTTITVTVRDQGGGVLAGVPVTLTATGEENRISPESGTTNAAGVATFSFSSTVAEHKTITATAGGVVLTTQPEITVFLASSTTTITSIEPETSVAGQEITVTVTVRGEMGGTPTGTVAVFSFQEQGVGCDAATLDSQGVATCTFALTTVTTHTIAATYHGDDQYQESAADGEDHVVTASSMVSQRAASGAGR